VKSGQTKGRKVGVGDKVREGGDERIETWGIRRKRHKKKT
jgi:hypothetical protein